MITRVEALKCLRSTQKWEDEDVQMAHLVADRVLCELLTTLGCGDVVEEWRKIRKWYA